VDELWITGAANVEKKSDRKCVFVVAKGTRTAAYTPSEVGGAWYREPPGRRAHRGAAVGWKVLGSTPHPPPTEPLRNVWPVKAGVPGGDKGTGRDRSPHEGTVSRSEPADGDPSRVAGEGRHLVSPFVHRSFARRWVKRDLGLLERLRGPLPVLESARRRRRVLGRGDGSGSAANARPPRFIGARPPPAVRGARPTCGGRHPQGWRLVQAGIGIRGRVRGS
jgi:hypothetical protein